MMSAGLLGSEGLGYAKDRFAAEELKQVSPALYEAYQADKPSKFTIFEETYGLDGTKLEDAKKAEPKSAEQQTVVDANILGDRRTLVADSLIPAAMAVIYIGLLLYFKAIGGYKPVSITREQIAGGIEGPMEA
jgi:hypothetical protein